MPCRSTYPSMTRIESALSRIYYIFDELDGIEPKPGIPHPRLKEGDCTETRLHQETSKLCATLQQITDMRQYSLPAQSWWLQHQISDFKRLQCEYDKQLPTATGQGLSSYEQALLDGHTFLRTMVVDACSMISLRFENFNQEGNPDWQRNITRHSFVQLMSVFELFSALLYCKLQGRILEDHDRFKYYDSSETYWTDALSISYTDILPFQDQFDLRRYYEKFVLVTMREKPAKSHFLAVPVKRAESEHLIYTISDCTNLIRIIRQVVDELIDAVS